MALRVGAGDFGWKISLSTAFRCFEELADHAIELCCRLLHKLFSRWQCGEMFSISLANPYRGKRDAWTWVIRVDVLPNSFFSQCRTWLEVSHPPRVLIRKRDSVLLNHSSGLSTAKASKKRAREHSVENKTKKAENAKTTGNATKALTGCSAAAPDCACATTLYSQTRKH